MFGIIFFKNCYLLRHYILLLNLYFATSNLNLLFFRLLGIGYLIIINIFIHCKTKGLLLLELWFHNAIIMHIHCFFSAAIHQWLIFILLYFLCILMLYLRESLFVFIYSIPITVLQFWIQNSLRWARSTQSQILVHTLFFIFSFLRSFQRLLFACIAFFNLVIRIYFVIFFFMNWKS